MGHRHPTYIFRPEAVHKYRSSDIASTWSKNWFNCRDLIIQTTEVRYCSCYRGISSTNNYSNNMMIFPIIYTILSNKITSNAMVLFINNTTPTNVRYWIQKAKGRIRMHSTLFGLIIYSHWYSVRLFIKLIIVHFNFQNIDVYFANSKPRLTTCLYNPHS